MSPPGVSLAVMCAAEHDVTGALCARIFCDGAHSADGDDWTAPTGGDADA